jgi:hypothetical protein
VPEVFSWGGNSCQDKPMAINIADLSKKEGENKEEEKEIKDKLKQV